MVKCKRYNIKRIISLLYAHYNKYERCKMKMKFKKNKHELEVAETPDQIMEDATAEELETLDEREPEILDDVSASDFWARTERANPRP